MEGGPQINEGVNGGNHDKEAVLEAARVELQERLLDIQVPEGTPEEFHEMVKLEEFAASIEDPQAERHLIKAANVELNDLMATTAHGVVQAFERYKLELQVFGAANDNREPVEQAA